MVLRRSLGEHGRRFRLRLISWVIVERVKVGKPTLVGAATGLVAGLVVITPAAGFVELGLRSSWAHRFPHLLLRDFLLQGQDRLR